MKTPVSPSRVHARDLWRSETLRVLLFLIAGGLNTLGSLAVFQVATAVSHRPVAALAVSYLVGAGVTYVTGSRLVFADHHAPSPPRFIAGLLAVFAINLLLQLVLRQAGVDPRLSQIGLAPVMACVSYAVNRRLLFHRRRALRSPEGGRERGSAPSPATIEPRTPLPGWRPPSTPGPSAAKAADRGAACGENVARST